VTHKLLDKKHPNTFSLKSCVGVLSSSSEMISSDLASVIDGFGCVRDKEDGFTLE
jgi:hypothetical protein